MIRSMRKLALVPLIVCLVGVCLLWASEPVTADGPEGGRIEGVVTNLTTGAPPEGSVDVVVNGWMLVHSGRDGEWNITGLQPGEYSVELGLPPAYFTPAQDVITATIWGDNTEVVNLAYYEGQAPASAATPAPDVAGRVAPLGATATPTVSVSPTLTASLTVTASLMATATGVVTPEVSPETDGEIPGKGGSRAIEPTSGIFTGRAGTGHRATEPPRPGVIRTLFWAIVGGLMVGLLGTAIRREVRN